LQSLAEQSNIAEQSNVAINRASLHEKKPPEIQINRKNKIEEK
jgi:hypothetical protein